MLMKRLLAMTASAKHCQVRDPIITLYSVTVMHMKHRLVLCQIDVAALTYEVSLGLDVTGDLRPVSRVGFCFVAARLPRR